MSKPTFYEAKLIKVKGNVLEKVYPQFDFTNGKKPMTMTERMGSEEANCPNCNNNQWIILSKESAIVREGGKPFIECICCGEITHL